MHVPVATGLLAGPRHPAQIWKYPLQVGVWPRNGQNCTLSTRCFRVAEEWQSELAARGQVLCDIGVPDVISGQIDMLPAKR